MEAAVTGTSEPGEANPSGSADPLGADEPIAGRAFDSLKRAAFADAVAAGITTEPRAAGFVVGLVGPWGVGKSSILNMVEEVLAQRSDMTVLRFNPWLFSGTEQLTRQFFREISAQLIETKDPKLRKVGEKLLGYGEALTAFVFIPGIGHALSALGAIAKVTERIRERNSKPGPSLEQQRDVLQAAMRELDGQLVIIIDDIDRLEHREIRDVMRLVRVTAHFQNVVYLLAFDRAKVEQALAQSYDGNRSDGQDYLEKILQVTYGVLEIRREDLQVTLLTELDRVIEATPHSAVSAADLINVVHLAIIPMVRTIRDIRRYINSLPATVRMVGDEVALSDVLALEALRVLEPNAFTRLGPAVQALSDLARAQTFQADAQIAEKLAREDFLALVAADPERQQALMELCRRLFPPSQRFFGAGNVVYPGEWYCRWRRERRVAHPEVFRLFLEKSLPSGVLPARKVRELFEALGDTNRLTLVLDSLAPSNLPEALRRLEDYEDEFPTENVAGAGSAFMNQLPRLPHTESATSLHPSLLLARIVLRQLRRVEDERARLEVVEDALRSTLTLSAQVEVVRLVGHRERVGHRLVPADDAARLEKQACQAILASPAAQLANEPDLMMLVGWVEYVEGASGAEAVRGLIGDPSLLVSLLTSALSEAIAGPVGDAAVTKQSLLPWEWLGRALGEERLRERVKELAASPLIQSLDERSLRAVALAQRYASGWRPEDVFGLGSTAPSDTGSGPYAE